MRETLERELVLAALSMALTHRQPAQGVLHHSDRGSQYASADYRALLTAHGLEASMSRRGDCWDNAPGRAALVPFLRDSRPPMREEDPEDVTRSASTRLRSSGVSSPIRFRSSPTSRCGGWS